MGKNFRIALEKRLIGDYDYSESVAKEEAEEVLKSGIDFVKNVKDYLKQNNYI